MTKTGPQGFSSKHPRLLQPSITSLTTLFLTGDAWRLGIRTNKHFPPHSPSTAANRQQSFCRSKSDLQYTSFNRTTLHIRCMELVHLYAACLLDNHRVSLSSGSTVKRREKPYFVYVSSHLMDEITSTPTTFPLFTWFPPFRLGAFEEFSSIFA